MQAIVVRMDIFSGWTFFPDGRFFRMDGTYAHNLISKPHSIPPYTPYTTELVVAGSKAYRNDQL